LAGEPERGPRRSGAAAVAPHSPGARGLCVWIYVQGRIRTKAFKSNKEHKNCSHKKYNTSKKRQNTKLRKKMSRKLYQEMRGRQAAENRRRGGRKEAEKRRRGLGGLPEDLPHQSRQEEEERRGRPRPPAASARAQRGDGGPPSPGSGGRGCGSCDRHNPRLSSRPPPRLLSIGTQRRTELTDPRPP